MNRRAMVQASKCSSDLGEKIERPTDSYNVGIVSVDQGYEEERVPGCPPYKGIIGCRQPDISALEERLQPPINHWSP